MLIYLPIKESTPNSDGNFHNPCFLKPGFYKGVQRRLTILALTSSFSSTHGVKMSRQQFPKTLQRPSEHYARSPLEKAVGHSLFHEDFAQAGSEQESFTLPILGV